MPDGYTTNMRDHLADCYQARGLSSAGSEQVANQQTPTSPTDKAMMGAIQEGAISGSTVNELPPQCYESNEYGMPRQIPCPDSKPDQAADQAAGKNSKECTFWCKDETGDANSAEYQQFVSPGDKAADKAMNW